MRASPRRGHTGSRSSRDDGASVGFLGDEAHLSLDVAQQEESDGGGAADQLGHPEGRFPAVVLGDGAERKPGQEAADCRAKRADARGAFRRRIQAESGGGKAVRSLLAMRATMAWEVPQ